MKNNDIEKLIDEMYAEWRRTGDIDYIPPAILADRHLDSVPRYGDDWLWWMIVAMALVSLVYWAIFGAVGKERK